MKESRRIKMQNTPLSILHAVYENSCEYFTACVASTTDGNVRVTDVSDILELVIR
jgi:hypothetical protein